jgi:type II secretory pathway pseudopilin PulG
MKLGKRFSKIGNIATKRLCNKCAMTDYVHKELVSASCDLNPSPAFQAPSPQVARGKIGSVEDMKGNSFTDKVYSLFTTHHSLINNDTFFSRFTSHFSLKKTGATHVAHWDNSRKIAFTLAEVLITLGIIGVVAALTIPTLMANHRKKVVETKLEKIYSVMNQAINLTNAEYGDVTNWIIDCGSSNSPTCSINEVENWFNSTIGKHLETLKTGKTKNKTDDILLIYLKDGSILGVTNYIYDMVFYVNSDAISNARSGKNYFLFRFNPILLSHQNNEEAQKDLKYSLKPTFEPYSNYWNGTREQLIDGHSFSCAQNHAFCAKLIQYDGWKISKDYPVKF